MKQTDRQQEHRPTANPVATSDSQQTANRFAPITTANGGQFAPLRRPTGAQGYNRPTANPNDQQGQRNTDNGQPCCNLRQPTDGQQVCTHHNRQRGQFAPLRRSTGAQGYNRPTANPVATSDSQQTANRFAPITTANGGAICAPQTANRGTGVQQANGQPKRPTGAKEHGQRPTLLQPQTANRRHRVQQGGTDPTGGQQAKPPPRGAHDLHGAHTLYTL